MKTRKLLLCLSAVCLLAGVLGSSAPLQSSDRVSDRLGLYDLPYRGSGSLIYDGEADSWLIAFEAPPGWACTHVGYEFGTAGLFDLRASLGLDSIVDLDGLLTVDRREDLLIVTIATDDGFRYHFEFLIHGQLPVDETGPLAAEENCPGGSCSCYHGCSACCGAGYYPYCNCKKDLCRCFKEKDDDNELELMSNTAEEF